MSYSALSFAHLRVDGLSKTFPDRRVFTNISFSVPHQDRVGIIGENGSGKTTLLRVIAGDLTPDAGTVETFGDESNIGLLQQQPQFPLTMTMAESLEASVARLRAAEADVHDAAQAMADQPNDQHVLDRYTAALETAQRLDVWATDTRMETTVEGLGLGQLDQHKTLGQLSGGQLARLSMACLLLSTPDILLLDEPTNHLDDAAIEYLATVISKWHGPVLLVSHDRAFLDETIVSILDLDPAPRPHALAVPDEDLPSIGVTRFTGSYTAYLQHRENARQRWQHQYEQEQAALRRLRAAVDDNQVVGHADWKPRTEVRMAQKFFADRNAKVVARRVNDARSRLQTLEQRQVVKPPRPLIFQGLDAAQRQSGTVGSSAERLISAREVTVEGRLAPVSVAVDAGSKLLVTGANGTGKSTLLQVLSGKLRPTGGSISWNTELRLGFLTQETEWNVSLDQTARAVYEQAVGVATAETVPLSTFGLLSPRDEHRPVNTLSTGQQRRLALATILAEPPEVLFLDEPTNHISLLLATELEASIEQYAGAVVIASHDRWLRRRWQGQHLHLDC